MTTDWVIYCVAWSLLASGAAWIIEGVLRRGRAPLRAVWIAALTLSTVGPVVGYFLPRATAFALPTTSSLSSPAAVVTTFAATRYAPMRRAAVSTVGPSADMLMVGWGVLSAAMCLYVVIGIVYLQYLRRHWRSASVCGTDVMVSEDTGPAVVGMVRPEIVIPKWALELDPRQLSLVLHHEREHRRAGDAALLALAQLTVVVLPWNPIVWWQVRRLRLAIELDCDARVLRAEPDVRSYGNLLLEVGRPRRAFALAGASLADRAGDLEQRIRMMTRRATGVSKVGVMLSLSAGLVAIVAGCGLPAPQHPAPSVAPPKASANTPASRTTTSTADTAVTIAPPTGASAATADSAELARVAALFADVNAKLSALRAQYTALRLHSEMADELQRQQSADSLLKTPAWRAMQSFPIQTDSEAAASSITACSAGAGSDDSYVVKLLVTDSLARVGGRIDLDVGGAEASLTDAKGRVARTSITLIDPDKRWPLMSCGMNRAGTLRLYGPDAFNGSPIVVNVAGPTSVIVTTGSGRLLAGPVVLNEKRRYSMAWSAIP